MKIIKIELLGAWVLEHREDEALPAEVIKNLVEKEFSSTLQFSEGTLTEVIFVINTEEYDEAQITSKITSLFLEKYSLAENQDIISIRFIEGTEKENCSSAETTEEKKEETKIDWAEKVSSLVGCEEFKLLVKEITEIAPEIIKNKTFDIFSYQTYLFSINDGYGLSTYLKVFAALLSSLRIKNIKVDGAVIEEKLAPPKGDSLEPFVDVQRVLRHGRKGSAQLLCIDISEWINDLNSRLFKDFLVDVERHMEDFIIVFRVPFVDKEVLNNLRYSLNDLMFVKTISFPPFTKEEIQKFANAEFDRYGFRIDEMAWGGFHERIAEEKSDGKFYGLNTIKKVVRELLYSKQLTNARSGQTNLLIEKVDTDAICDDSFGKGLSGYELLDKLVGGQVLKARINEIIAQIELARKNADLQTPCIHMRFVGNPGTGKTTVARIIGKILKEKGVLRIGNFYEYAGRDFCGRYIGETAPKTASMCRDAYGSVLFIDEAYSLYRGDDNDKDYGREVIDTLIAEMENHRSDLVVIMAGYTDDMEKLMQSNAGLASRMPYIIEFPNFTRQELYEVFVSMLNNNFQYEDELLSKAKEYFDSISDEMMQSKAFSNARFVRNLFERTWAKASMRCQLENNGDVIITKSDFDRAISDKEFTLIQKKKNRIGFAL